MTSPKLANLSLWGEANAWKEARAYRHPGTGEHYASVTSILKGVPKDLTQYAANEMLRYCIAHWQDLSNRSDERAFSSFKYRWRDHAELRGHVGDSVHNYLEAIQTGSWEFPELNEEETQIVEQWDLLSAQHEVIPIRNEVTVGDPELGWMGTFDTYCLLDGVLTMGDFKTSKGVYDTAMMQLAALANAKEWYIETSDMVWEIIEPEPIEQCVVFHLRAEKWAVAPVEDLDVHYEKYVYYTKLWHANQELKKREKSRESEAAAVS